MEKIKHHYKLWERLFKCVKLSDLVEIVLQYTEKRLWEYPLTNFINMSDVDACDSWYDFTRMQSLKKKPVSWFQWCEDDDYSTEREEDEDIDGQQIVTFSFADHCPIDIKIKKEDEPEIRNHLQVYCTHFQSKVDVIFPIGNKRKRIYDKKLTFLKWR